MMPFACLMSYFIAASLNTQSGPECGLGEGGSGSLETTGQKGTDPGGLSRALGANTELNPHQRLGASD